MLNTFFEGEGDAVLENIFSNEISISTAFRIRDAVEKYPEKFNSEDSYRKICDRRYDFKRLEFGITLLSIDDDLEFELLQKYLLKDLTLQEFHKMLEQIGKIERRVDSHENNKVFVPIVDDVFSTENTRILKGNNREVEFNHPYSGKGGSHFAVFTQELVQRFQR